MDGTIAGEIGRLDGLYNMMAEPLRPPFKVRFCGKIDSGSLNEVKYAVSENGDVMLKYIGSDRWKHEYVIIPKEYVSKVIEALQKSQQPASQEKPTPQ